MTAREGRHRRPWWLLAFGYALGVIVYVAGTLPETGARPTADGGSSLGRPSRRQVKFAAVGEIGSDPGAEHLLKSVGKAQPDFFLPLGGLSHAGPSSEGSWCGLVDRTVGPKVPVQLVAGDNEADAGADGSIAEFAQCLPSRRQASGSYPTQYFFDEGTLLRTIVISPGLSIEGRQYSYAGHSEEERWLRGVLDDARRKKLSWIVVAMHKPCLSIGQDPCEIRSELLNLLIEYRVDLVLHGHDQTYQRTVQLARSPICPEVPVGVAANPDCVVHDGRDNAYRSGLGPIFVVVASGTGSLSPLNDQDGDGPYVVAAMGANRKPTNGFLKVTLDAKLLTARFVKTSGQGDFDDRFEISR